MSSHLLAAENEVRVLSSLLERQPDLMPEAAIAWEIHQHILHAIEQQHQNLAAIA